MILEKLPFRELPATGPAVGQATNRVDGRVQLLRSGAPGETRGLRWMLHSQMDPESMLRKKSSIAVGTHM